MNLDRISSELVYNFKNYSKLVTTETLALNRL